eukprot:10817790-Lingulodinium_polyedra.AAC.1
MDGGRGFGNGPVSGAAGWGPLDGAPNQRPANPRLTHPPRQGATPPGKTLARCASVARRAAR